MPSVSPSSTPPLYRRTVSPSNSSGLWALGCSYALVELSRLLKFGISPPIRAVEVVPCERQIAETVCGDAAPPAPSDVLAELSLQVPAEAEPLPDGSYLARTTYRP